MDTDATLEARVRAALKMNDNEDRVRALLDLMPAAVEEVAAGTDADTHPIKHVWARDGGHERMVCAVAGLQCGKIQLQRNRLEAALRDHPDLVVEVVRVDDTPKPVEPPPPVSPAPIVTPPWYARALARVSAWMEERRQRRLFRRMAREIERNRLEPVDLTQWRSTRRGE